MATKSLERFSLSYGIWMGSIDVVYGQLASENIPQLLPAEAAASSDNAKSNNAKQEAIAVENIDRPA